MSQFLGKKDLVYIYSESQSKSSSITVGIFNQYGLVLGGKQEEGGRGEGGGGARAFRIPYFLPGLVVTV